MPTVRVRFEQAVYGSFPFWDRGYALLAQSPGCRPEWLAEFLAACQRYRRAARGFGRGARPVLACGWRAAPGSSSASAPRGTTTGDAPGPWRSTPSSSPRATTARRVTSRSASPGPCGATGRPRPGPCPREPGRSRSPARRTPPHDPRALRIAAILARGGRRGARGRPGRSTRWRGRSGSRSPIGPGGGPRSRPGPSATATGSTWSPCPAWRASSSTPPTSTRPDPLPPGEGGRRPGEGPRPREGQPASSPRTWLPSWCGRRTLSALAAVAILAGVLLGLARAAATARTRPVAGRPDDRRAAPRPSDRTTKPRPPPTSVAAWPRRWGHGRAVRGRSPPTRPPATPTRPR